MCVCVCSENNLQGHSLSSSYLLFKTASLNCLELHRAGPAVWPQGPGTCLPLPGKPSTTGVSVLGFPLGSGDLSSGCDTF